MTVEWQTAERRTTILDAALSDNMSNSIWHRLDLRPDFAYNKPGSAIYFRKPLSSWPKACRRRNEEPGEW